MERIKDIFFSYFFFFIERAIPSGCKYIYGIHASIYPDYRQELYISQTLALQESHISFCGSDLAAAAADAKTISMPDCGN